MSENTYYLGHATGVYQGYNYCSLYLCEPMKSDSAHGFVCYKKKFRGDVSDLSKLQPGTPVSCSYNRYGDVAGVEVTF